MSLENERSISQEKLKVFYSFVKKEVGKSIVCIEKKKFVKMPHTHTLFWQSMPKQGVSLKKLVENLNVGKTFHALPADRQLQLMNLQSAIDRFIYH